MRLFSAGVLEALDNFEKAVRADELKHDMDGLGNIPSEEEALVIEQAYLEARDKIEQLLSELY